MLVRLVSVSSSASAQQINQQQERDWHADQPQQDVTQFSPLIATRIPNPLSSAPAAPQWHGKKSMGRLVSATSDCVGFGCRRRADNDVHDERRCGKWTPK